MSNEMNGQVEAPSLREIRETWPASVGVTRAAMAFGLSRSHAYVLIAQGQFPAKVLLVGKRYKVITESVVAALSGGP